MEPTVSGSSPQLGASTADKPTISISGNSESNSGSKSEGQGVSSDSNTEGSGSNSDSDSDSDSNSDSDSDSITARPVFIKKKGLKKLPQKEPHIGSSALAKAEQLQKVHLRASDAIPFDGVNDTDDVNPEVEYENWKIRERDRRARDAGMLAESEQQKEDFLRRRKAQLPI